MRLAEADTLAKFQWLFRDTALWAVDVHSPSGGLNAIREVLNRLEIADMDIGPGVEIRNRYDLMDLPVDTIVSQGSPDNYERYQVWRWGVNGGRTSLLGPGAAQNRPYLIVEMPGHDRPRWLDQEPEPDEAQRLVTWKKQAYTVGYEAKMEHRWCNTFESVMSSLGVYR